MSDRLDFVDTHVHFWDLKHPTLRYGWLAPEAVHPILGDIDGIKAVKFDGTHLHAEARFTPLVKAVHVQAAVGSEDPVDETAWLTEMAQQGRYPNAIVAHVDLAEATARDVIARHAESPLLRGIRDFTTEMFLRDPAQFPAFRAGVAEVQRAGLVLDLDCEWPNMAAARRLAEDFPEVTFVLEHIGYPRERTPEYFRAWRDGIEELAQAPNVHCKISGVGMRDPLWTFESVSSWIEHCIQSFGPPRCFFGTNWPVDRLYSSYDAIVQVYAWSIASYPPDEQRAMFSTNATRVYKL
jgi:predicted TIM-barrel fold metal-dependent hydrolase